MNIVHIIQHFESNQPLVICNANGFLLKMIHWLSRTMQAAAWMLARGYLLKPRQILIYRLACLIQLSRFLILMGRSHESKYQNIQIIVLTKTI